MGAGDDPLILTWFRLKARSVSLDRDVVILMGILFRQATQVWFPFSCFCSLTLALDERLMLQLLRRPVVVTVTWTLPFEVPELLRTKSLRIVGVVLRWKSGLGVELEQRFDLRFGDEEREVGVEDGASEEGDGELLFRVRIGGGVSERVADETLLGS